MIIKIKNVLKYKKLVNFSLCLLLFIYLWIDLIFSETLNTFFSYQRSF